MKSKLEIFVDGCISCGCYIEIGFNLPQKEILEIEYILCKYNDTTARNKIRKKVKIHLSEV